MNEAIRSALAGPLSGFTAYRQFLPYKTVWNERKGKNDKLPCSPYTGAVCDAHDSNQWVDWQTSLVSAEAFGLAGVAFVLSDSDPFWFLDIDHAFTNGAWSDLAKSLCGYFNGAAIEVSNSGTGLHIFGQGRVPEHGTRNGGLGLEFYTRKRFVALTGTAATGAMGLDWSAHLAQFLPAYFPPGVAGGSSDAKWTTEPCPEWRGPNDDDLLIDRMMRARPSAAAGFGSTATVQELWHADEDAMRRAYPDGNGSWDQSRADLALAVHLAWWTGKNCERIERLMRRSALAREKWDTHRTYLRDFTISKAVANATSCYVEAPPPAPIAPVATAEDVARPQPHTGGFMTPEQQLEYFRDCVYVKDRDRVLTANGMLLDQSRFNATYAGYSFKVDETNSKVSTKAWDAFIYNMAYAKPVVDRLYFNPRHEPRNVQASHGLTEINTWKPKFGVRQRGDASPFLAHIANLLPSPEDQRILISYMAACVQHVGVKFRWAVVLQGCEGNGKSLTADILSYALGSDYVHPVRGAQIDAKFNGWMQNRLLIVVNDIKTSSAKQEEVMETLKPMITENQFDIETKGVDGHKQEVFCNYLFTMNSRDGLRKTRNDRRYCIFFTEQQSAEDLDRCGMGVKYFQQLTDWLKNGGMAITADYLASVAIPDELNPATLCQRAPKTTKWVEVLDAGLSGQAQILLESSAEGRIGLQGGYMSASVAQDVLRENNIRSIGPKGLDRIMREIGYAPHVLLPGGRSLRATAWDNGKRSIIYVKNGHLSLNFENEHRVMEDYTKVQTAASATYEGPSAAVVAFGPRPQI